MIDLFAGLLVSDYATARPWYERLLGAPPSFDAHETESVWELPSTASCMSSKIGPAPATRP